MRKNNDNVFWIGMNSFFTDFSSEMIKPVLPLFLTLLGAPAFVVTLFFNVSEFLSNVLKITFGAVSDKYGRYKESMMAGYAISNLLKPFMGFFPNLIGIFTIELLNKVGKGIRTAPKEVIMKNSIAENKMGLGFGFQKSMDSLGAFVGTIVATLIVMAFGYSYGVIQMMFMATIVPGLVSAYIVWKKVDFSDSDAFEKGKKKSFSFSKLSNLGPVFWNLVFVTALTSVANVGIVFYMLSLMKFEIPYYQITFLYALYMLTDSFLGYHLGKLSDGKKTLVSNVFFGYAGLGLSLVLMLFVSGLSSVSSALYLLSVGAFVSYGIYESVFETGFKKLFTMNTSKEFEGTVLGSYSGISGIVKVVAGIPLAMVFMSGGGTISYSVCLMALLLSAASLIVLLKTGEVKTSN